jgi:hypothetical protein
MTSDPNHVQKSGKNQWRQTKRHQKQKKHQSTAEKNHPATKAHQKKLRNHYRKPPSHESTTEKIVRAQSSNPVQPPKLKKPQMIKKMVEPISKKKVAWETTEEERKTTIGAQHVHEFFNNLNTKQQRRELEKTKKVDSAKLGFLKLMSENSKKLMPILALTSSNEDTRAKKLE